jgi:hypothetical protein
MTDLHPRPRLCNREHPAGTVNPNPTSTGFRYPAGANVNPNPIRCDKLPDHDGPHETITTGRVTWSDHDVAPFRPHERETLEAAARNALDLCDRLRRERDGYERRYQTTYDQLARLEAGLDQLRQRFEAGERERDTLAYQRDRAEAIAEIRGRQLDRLEADPSQDEPADEPARGPGEPRVVYDHDEGRPMVLCQDGECPMLRHESGHPHTGFATMDRPFVCTARHPEYDVKCIKPSGHKSEHVYEDDEGKGVVWR